GHVQQRTHKPKRRTSGSPCRRRHGKKRSAYEVARLFCDDSLGKHRPIGKVRAMGAAIGSALRLAQNAMYEGESLLAAALQPQAGRSFDRPAYAPVIERIVTGNIAAEARALQPRFVAPQYALQAHRILTPRVWPARRSHRRSRRNGGR